HADEADVASQPGAVEGSEALGLHGERGSGNGARYWGRKYSFGSLRGRRWSMPAALTTSYAVRKRSFTTSPKPSGPNFWRISAATRFTCGPAPFGSVAPNFLESPSM